MHDNLDSKAVTSESSKLWHYNWHLHNRIMWGEFNSNVFEGTFDYQFSNIIYFQRNFLAPHIGGFFASANGLNEFHWIGSKIAAFDAGSLIRGGSGFTDSKKAVLKAWIEATKAGAFSDWQRARLLPWERTFDLVELEAGRHWRLKDRAVTLDYNASTKSKIAVLGYGATTSNPFQLARPWAGFPNRNVAGDALVTASSEPAGDAGFQPDNAVDGLIGYFDPALYGGEGEVSEWHADASDAAPWIQLDWDSSQTVRAVLLYDRSDPGANVTSYRLDFSSGAPLTFVAGLPERGAFKEHAIDGGRKTTLLKITITGYEGDAPGLGEVVVIADDQQFKGNLTKNATIESGYSGSDGGNLFDGSLSTSNNINPGMGLRNIVIDLEDDKFWVDGLNVWKYYDDANAGRSYHDLVYQLSPHADFSRDVTTVFNNDSDNSANQGVGATRSTLCARTATRSIFRRCTHATCACGPTAATTTGTTTSRKCKCME